MWGIPNDVIATNIRRCGHKPFGDSPGHIRSSGSTPAGGSSTLGGFEVVCADTSFSDMTAPDNRGAAVSEVLIHGQSEWNQVQVHGTLADGAHINYRLPPVGDASVGACAAGNCAGEAGDTPPLLAGDTLVGRPLKNKPDNPASRARGARVGADAISDGVVGEASPLPQSIFQRDWEGWWVKTPVYNTGAALEYLVVKGKGFEIEVERLKPDHVMALVA